MLVNWVAVIGWLLKFSRAILHSYVYLLQIGLAGKSGRNIGRNSMKRMQFQLWDSDLILFQIFFRVFRRNLLLFLAYFPPLKIHSNVFDSCGFISPASTFPLGNANAYVSIAIIRFLFGIFLRSKTQRYVWDIAYYVLAFHICIRVFPMSE